MNELFGFVTELETPCTKIKCPDITLNVKAMGESLVSIVDQVAVMNAFLGFGP